jgi:hypothetical protein
MSNLLLKSYCPRGWENTQISSQKNKYWWPFNHHYFLCYLPSSRKKNININFIQNFCNGRHSITTILLVLIHLRIDPLHFQIHDLQMIEKNEWWIYNTYIIVAHSHGLLQVGVSQPYLIGIHTHTPWCDPMGPARKILFHCILIGPCYH